MGASTQFLDIEDLDPIDIVEQLAAHQDWEFDRIADNQIAMAVQGQWRTYSITLAWSDFDETLRLICTFDMEPPAHRKTHLNAALNAVNDNCWAGAFTYWEDQNLMVYRYGLILAGRHTASADQIDTMISAAVMSAERYYPAFQLVTWGERELADAMQVAIAEAYGRA
ncbi:MAG: YbjN domain-containing protein [Pseudomonadota bacterium]